MRFDLAAIVRRAKNPRRKSIPLREIAPTSALASELAAVYLPIVRAWSAASERVIVEYGRSLAQVRDGMITDSASDLGNTLDFAAGEINRLLLTLTPQLRSWALRVERWHRSRWIANTLSATGISLETLIGPTDVAETVETVIARNVALVRDVSEQARGRLSDIVFRNFTKRMPAREVAREMREAVAMSRRRALLIASDQTTKLAAELDGERMRQAGISAWIWRHSGKRHPREDHRKRNGNRYTFADPPDVMPGELPYCGCRKQAVVEFD